MKNFASDLNVFSRVYGSGTQGALCITALFTACKSCTILHPTEGAAFFTGNIGVLQGESSHGIITPAVIRSSITGFMPS